MNPKEEMRLLQRYIDEANARRRVHHNVHGYQFLVAGNNAWSSSDVPLNGRGEVHMEEIRNTEFRSMTLENIAKFMSCSRPWNILARLPC